MLWTDGAFVLIGRCVGKNYKSEVSYLNLSRMLIVLLISVPYFLGHIRNVPECCLKTRCERLLSDPHFLYIHEYFTISEVTRFGSQYDDQVVGWMVRGSNLIGGERYFLVQNVQTVFSAEWVLGSLSWVIAAGACGCTLTSS